MEPAETSFLLARESQPQMVQPGEAQGPAKAGGDRTVPTILSLVVTGGLASGPYWARDLGLVVITTYLLVAICCCLRKLVLLRREDDPAAAPERRRDWLSMWAASMALGCIIAAWVANATPNDALKVGLWMLAGLAMGLSCYLLYARGDARADGGQWPEQAPQEVSPEQRV